MRRPDQSDSMDAIGSLPRLELVGSRIALIPQDR